MSMIVRRRIRYDGEEVISDVVADVDWHEVRTARDAELVRTDVWALQDRVITDEQTDYRVMLRDLPQDHATAGEAADAWNAYEKPEE